MTAADAVVVTTPTDREVVLTRTFNAPRQHVFDAFTQPAMLRQWLGVYGGSTLEVCDMELRVGGTYRWVWRLPDGHTMGMRGEVLDLAMGHRLALSEEFDDPWYPGHATSSIVLTETTNSTILVQTVKYESREARDKALATPMLRGIEAGFRTLDAVLQAPPAV